MIVYNDAGRFACVQDVMQMLQLDLTKIDSVRFSFATRKRLYFANFDCQSESELPQLEGSPTLSGNKTPFPPPVYTKK
eukprot:COSAG06_NODE_3706_length_4994_cov_5.256588_6_plen_78_part_00